MARASTWIENNVSMDYVYANADDNEDCRPEEYDGDSFVSTSAYWEYGMRVIGVPGDSQHIDTYPQFSELADATFGGRDHTSSNIDTPDAVFIGTHGNCSWSGGTCLQFRAALGSKYGVPVPALGCQFSTYYMRLGNNNAEIADLYSCYSNEPSFAALMLETPSLHQWHGNYGLGNTVAKYYLDDYVDDAKDDSASYAWIENLTRFNVPEVDYYDLCATSLVRGNTNADAYTRLAYENYGSYDYGDPSGAGDAYHYICNCHPIHPSGLPIGC